MERDLDERLIIACGEGNRLLDAGADVNAMIRIHQRDQRK